MTVLSWIAKDLGALNLIELLLSANPPPDAADIVVITTLLWP